MVLFWVDDRDERERLRAYAVSLGGGTALALPRLRLQRQSARGVRRACRRCGCRMRCSAARCCSRWPGCRPATGSGGWRWRVGAGVVVAAFHALMWPHCLQRLEGVSPEVERLWLSHVKEARPVYHARLAHRDADRRAAGHRRDRLGSAHLDAAARSASCCGASLGAAVPGFAATAAAVLADAHRARRRR